MSGERMYLDRRRGVVVWELPPEAARDVAQVIRDGLPWNDGGQQDATTLDQLADDLTTPPDGPGLRVGIVLDTFR